LQSTEDTRIGDVRPLLPPACLCEELPLTLAAKQTVIAARQAVQAVLDDTDDRLVVIVGPCSIHDIKAAKEYGMNRNVGQQQINRSWSIKLEFVLAKMHPSSKQFESMIVTHLHEVASEAAVARARARSVRT
jgi:phospho-2-dehydro-3-deoxyheptonate aldolase